MTPKTKSKTDFYSSRQETWGRPCLQVVNSALTKPKAMIHNKQARNNYPDPESFTEHWQFQRASQHTAPKFIWG